MAYIREIECRTIHIITIKALDYAIDHLKKKYYLSNQEIQNLSSEDLNRLPEVIFADMRRNVLLFGWIPVFGWFFAGQYLIFKNRVKWLKSLTNGDIFKTEHITAALKRRSNISYDGGPY